MDHMKDNQKKDLKVLLNKHKKLFDRTLGVYPNNTFHIDIDPVLEPRQVGMYVAVPSLCYHSSDHRMQAQFEFSVCKLLLARARN